MSGCGCLQGINKLLDSFQSSISLGLIDEIKALSLAVVAANKFARISGCYSEYVSTETTARVSDLQMREESR